MGRRVAAPEIESRVRAQRLQRGLSQGELARQTGLTRQAISAIETGHYVPNTAVALRLAQSLRCGVEDLFALPPSAPRDIELIAGPRRDTPRLAVARIADRWVGYPL